MFSYSKMVLDAVVQGKTSIVDIQGYVRGQPLAFAFDEQLVSRAAKHLLATGRLAETVRGHYRIVVKKPKQKFSVKKKKANQSNVLSAASRALIEPLTSSMAPPARTPPPPVRTRPAPSLGGGASSSSGSSEIIRHEDLGESEFAGATILLDKELSCVNTSHNKFYHLQALRTTAGKFYSVFHWGRIGTKGQLQKFPFTSAEKAIGDCDKKFREKTKGNRYQEMQRRVAQAGGKMSTGTGGIQVSLMWNNDDTSGRNDLDLHVIPPSKEEIYFSHKSSGCGGALDVDRQQSSDQCVENTVWTSAAPVGMYEVYVKNYSMNYMRKEKDFDVSVTIGDQHEMFSSTMPPVSGEKMLIARFHYGGGEEFSYNFKVSSSSSSHSP